MEIDKESKTQIDDDDGSKTDWAPIRKKSSVPFLVFKFELNDLMQGLGLPKDGSELLASFLKRKNLFEPIAIVSVCLNKESQFRKYFMKDEDSSLVFCTDVKSLINELKANCYDAEDWRLFIDSSETSIKAVLLENTNVYAPISLGHSTVMQEIYEEIFL